MKPPVVITLVTLVSSIVGCSTTGQRLADKEIYSQYELKASVPIEAEEIIKIQFVEPRTMDIKKRGISEPVVSVAVNSMIAKIHSVNNYGMRVNPLNIREPGGNAWVFNLDRDRIVDLKFDEIEFIAKDWVYSPGISKHQPNLYGRDRITLYDAFLGGLGTAIVMVLFGAIFL